MTASPVRRFVWRGMTVGAAIGLGISLLLLASWWKQRHSSVRAYDEGLEGTALAAAAVGQPATYALFWVADAGGYPGAWIRFILLAPTLNGALLGALVGGCAGFSARRWQARRGNWPPA